MHIVVKIPPRYRLSRNAPMAGDSSPTGSRGSGLIKNHAHAVVDVGHLADLADEEAAIEES